MITLLELVPSILWENNRTIVGMYNEDLPSHGVTDLEMKRWEIRYERSLLPKLLH